MFQRFQRETKDLIRESIEISYWSRAAVQYDAAFDLTPIERDEWKEWLKNRIEQEVKKPNPNY